MLSEHGMRLNYTEVSRATDAQNAQKSGKENIGATVSGTVSAVSGLDITPQQQPKVDDEGGRNSLFPSAPEEVEAYYYR